MFWIALKILFSFVILVIVISGWKGYFEDYFENFWSVTIIMILATAILLFLGISLWFTF